MRHLGVDIVENTITAFSNPVTSDVATISSSLSVSQTLGRAKAALSKTQLIWLMCISHAMCSVAGGGGKQGDGRT